MSSTGGHWVRVRFSDATTRLDWIPDEQPPAPDSRPGAWHVLPDPAGGASRWEWHPGSSPRPLVVSLAEQAAPPPADVYETQPLLQAVPNRAPRAAAPLSVHPQPTFGAPTFGAPKAGRPVLRMRWAAWSLSVVLAIPVVYLLARPGGDDDADRTSAQSQLEDESASAADSVPGANPDTGETVTGEPLTGQPGAGLPGIDPTSTAPDSAADAASLGSTEPGDEAIDRYLRHLFELDSTQGYTFASLGDQYLLSTGTEACGSLDRGTTYDGVRTSVMYRIPNGGQLVVASAVTYLCPKHHEKLQAFTADSQAATSAQGSSPSSTQPADAAVG